MRIKLTIIALLSGLFWQSTSLAINNEQLSTIAEMGRLNGIALNCQYVQEIRQIKQILIANLPTKKALGVWFQQKTNDAYIAFMNSHKTCPGLIHFDKQLEQAKRKLQAAYKK